MTQDLIGEVGGLNLYGFVGNSSVNLIDLFGNDANDANLSSEQMLQLLNETATKWNDEGRKRFLKDWGWFGYVTDWPIDLINNVTGYIKDEHYVFDYSYYTEHHLCTDYADSLRDYMKEHLTYVKNLSIKRFTTAHSNGEQHDRVKVKYLGNTWIYDPWVAPAFFSRAAPVLPDSLTLKPVKE